ncbi:hypothetical protein Hanom_Chr09g00802241 [Helianthus anomalus]
MFLNPNRAGQDPESVAGRFLVLGQFNKGPRSGRSGQRFTASGSGRSCYVFFFFITLTKITLKLKKFSNTKTLKNPKTLKVYLFFYILYIFLYNL